MRPGGGDLRPAVFLDRDGVLNEAVVRDGRPYPPATVAQLRLLPGVVQACERLRALGYELVVITNQPDIARGTATLADVEAISDELRRRLPLTEVVMCPHDDADGCSCRKPRPGMLLDVADRLGLDLARSFCVGDRWRDIEAANAAGVAGIHVDYGYAERRPVGAVAAVDSLLSAVSVIESSPSHNPQGEGTEMNSYGLTRTKIFADGADVDTMVQLAARPEIAGFTTNPTLMRKSGVSNYEAFARKVLDNIPNHPISFEVFADEPGEMVRQARLIASWGDNVYVKIPVTTTARLSTAEAVAELTASGVRLNVTALMTVDQVRTVTAALAGTAGAVVSVFAGRIADTGRDPVPIMAEALTVTSAQPNVELLWASPREVLNLRQADEVGVDIITVTADLLAKLGLFGKSLDDYSLETVRMFFDDASAAGYRL